MIVRMLLDEGDIPWEPVFIDIETGQNRSEEFLAINPAGFVPALRTPEGEILFETAAILLYLAERHGLSELVPAAGDLDRGRFLSWFFFHTNELQPAFKTWFYGHRYTSDGHAGKKGNHSPWLAVVVEGKRGW